MAWRVIAFADDAAYSLIVKIRATEGEARRLAEGLARLGAEEILVEEIEDPQERLT